MSAGAMMVERLVCTVHTFVHGVTHGTTKDCTCGIVDLMLMLHCVALAGL